MGAVERRFRGASCGRGANRTFSELVLVCRRFRVGGPELPPGRSGKDLDGSIWGSDELGESSSSCCPYAECRMIIPTGFIAGIGLASLTVSDLWGEEGRLLDSLGRAMPEVFRVMVAIR
jgi:hypothetical protein